MTLCKKRIIIFEMDITLFRDLERLRQTGNFSQAATLANLSQPALSRRIKSLEDWVGAILVDRSHQPVTLTNAGHQMLEAGLQSIERIENERAQIREVLSLPDKYMITFGAQHSIGWRFYPAWLQSLEEDYGPILSRLRADDLPNCLRDLKNGTVDFVVAYQQFEGSLSGDFESVQIGSDQLIPVCKPNADGSPMFTFNQPNIEMPYLRFGDQAPISDLLKPLFAKHDLSTRLRTVYENAMAGALRMRAQAGDGVAWLPKSLVTPDLAQGLLVVVGEQDLMVDVQIRLLRNPERSNMSTRAIWTYLRKKGPVRSE